MAEVSLEEIIAEKAFVAILESHAEMFFRLANTLLARPESDWTRGQFFQLISEADTLEAFLDDYGARYNRTFAFLRELVASVRGIALAGFSVSHLERRMESYGLSLSMRDTDLATVSIQSSKQFLRGAQLGLLKAAREEGVALGLRVSDDSFPESRFRSDVSRQRLPRNMGQVDLENDEQKVAEVASKFLQACGMFEDLAVRRIHNEGEREQFMSRFCSEEQARVYEATVHNLQSAYDTHVKNTVLEARDSRLPKLRGHVSAALHLLEAVTQLTHFVERHESGVRNEAVEGRIGRLVERGAVREVTLNHLLYWAVLFMRRGKPLAEDLLPSYTNVQVLEVVLPEDVLLHARPAALIVGIVNRYGTPVEMEIAGRKCNAASILELMVNVGSHPHARQFTFRGDENPLRDIRLLFEHGLGEGGINSLPDELAYLRSNA
ncbi:MAG: HPr family phosphocarrier protein [Planctomycetota bacterium]